MENFDLVKVIEACGKHGVSYFKHGRLEIRFAGFVLQSETDYSDKVEKPQSIVVDPKFEDEAVKEQVLEDIDDLLVTDPLAYEDYISSDEPPEANV